MSKIPAAIIQPRITDFTRTRGSSTRAKVVRHIKNNSMEQWEAVAICYSKFYLL